MVPALPIAQRRTANLRADIFGLACAERRAPVARLYDLAECQSVTALAAQSRHRRQSNITGSFFRYHEYFKTLLGRHALARLLSPPVPWPQDGGP